MLESVKISRRQSEIRQALAGLVGKEKPGDDEVRSMSDLDTEYKTNETRYRAALIAEDTERREAGKELETRGGKQWSGLIDRFEVAQIAMALAEGRALDGATAEVVSELRSRGGFKGIPLPWAVFEKREGETVASGVPDPKQTRPIVPRLFPASAAVRMGAEMIDIPMGLVEYPVVSSAISGAWATSETGAVGSAQAFATTDRPLVPNYNYGVQLKVTRRSLLQTGPALEAAVRSDMASAIQAGLDAAVFQGLGSSGQPLGVVHGASTYGVAEAAAFGGYPWWAAFRLAITEFMVGNSAGGPGDVRILMRPEVFNEMDGDYIEGTAVSQFDLLTRNVPMSNIVMNSNALLAPAGDPPICSALLTTAAGGVPPIWVGLWSGALDLVRDPYSDAPSGGLRITGIATMDVSVSRPAQLSVITDIQIPSPES